MEKDKIVYFFTSEEQTTRIMRELLKLEGAFDYSGDYSWQVAFKLENGKMLRFIANDPPDIGHESLDGICIDVYEGLKIKKPD